MSVAAVLPIFQEAGELVTIDSVHVAAGQQLSAGDMLFDCTVDLSGINPHDCPPQTAYRVSTRERGQVHRVDVTAGQVVTAGDVLAILSSSSENGTVAPARQARLAIAAIMPANLW